MVMVFSFAKVHAQEKDPLLQGDNLRAQEDYALQLYQQGDYRRSEQLFRDIAQISSRGETRDRARYNASLAAYRQGELMQSLHLLEEIENPTPYSIRILFRVLMYSS